MDGFIDDWYLPSMDVASRTLVLMGRTGNGKSATGNSILGKKLFESRTSMSSVTNSVQCLTTTIANCEVINVIDTPGLFDSSFGLELITKEIMRCIDLEKDGIHAILLVFSVRTRFTEEEREVLENLQKFFGPKIIDYIIVVFTGGDTLEKNESLEKFLSTGFPDPLKKVLDVCKNRTVLFDNKTEDKKIKAMQLQKLLGLVDKVTEENDGKPYTNALFSDMKVRSYHHCHGQEKEDSNASNGSNDEQLKLVMEMVECKLKEANEKLQQQLAKEKAARLNAERVAQKRLEEEIRKLGERLAEAKKSTDNEMKEVKKNLAKVKKTMEAKSVVKKTPAKAAG